MLVKEGLGERAETDFLLVRDTCSALLKITGAKKVTSFVFVSKCVSLDV